MATTKDRFLLDGRVVVITGGAGLLGQRHAEAVADMGGTPVIADVMRARAEAVAGEMTKTRGVNALGVGMDVTDPGSVEATLATVLRTFGRVDGLVNNAANNPAVGREGFGPGWSRLENFPLDQWQADIAVGLSGAFLCSRVFGSEMARRGQGAVVNNASDLALIGPDQRLYRIPGLPEDQQPVKPVSYPVVKAGLLGLTRYLATYWADRGVRVNAICPGGVQTDQDPVFVRELSNRIPMGRMARPDEYQAAVVFLLSEASSYMTGATLVVDGGRTCW